MSQTTNVKPTYYYKGFAVEVVGLSHRIYTPKQCSECSLEPANFTGFAQSKAEAKRWINQEMEHHRNLVF